VTHRRERRNSWLCTRTEPTLKPSQVITFVFSGLPSGTYAVQAFD